MSAIRLLNKDKAKSAARREKWHAYVASLKYAKYAMFHPFDGFWDLTHEKRGSVAAATTFLAMFLITHVLRLLYTNFQFINAPLQYVNVFEQAASLLLPFLILCLSNWSCTTLFEGKGRFSDIYTAMCYALVPYVVIQLPLVLVSNMIATDEAAFYTLLLSFSVVWSVALMFVGLMQVHDYTPGKTVVFLIFTVLGAAIIIFLALVFISLLSDLAAFIISFYRECAFRLN